MRRDGPGSSRSECRECAAVDEVVGAGEVAGGAGEEEDDQGRDLLGFGDAAGGDAEVSRQPLEEGGVVQPGRAATLPPRAVGSAQMKVLTAPGETVFTRTPRGPNSRARDFPSEVRAALAAL
jgi:hypothetical protein